MVAVPWAFDLDRSPISPHRAAKRVDYACPVCDGRVRLRGGNTRRLHFFHVGDNIKCALGQGESAEHLRAKLRLQAAVLAALAGEAEFSYITQCKRQHESVRKLPANAFDCVLEVAIDSRRPDVLIRNRDRQPILAMEVFYTHRVTKEKFNDLERSGVPVVEVRAEDVLRTHGVGWTSHSHRGYDCDECIAEDHVVREALLLKERATERFRQHLEERVRRLSREIEKETGRLPRLVEMYRRRRLPADAHLVRAKAGRSSLTVRLPRNETWQFARGSFHVEWRRLYSPRQTRWVLCSRKWPSQVLLWIPNSEPPDSWEHVVMFDPSAWFWSFTKSRPLWAFRMRSDGWPDFSPLLDLIDAIRELQTEAELELGNDEIDEAWKLLAENKLLPDMQTMQTPRADRSERGENRTD